MSKRQADVGMNLRLIDARHFVFDRIFDGDDAALWKVD